MANEELMYKLNLYEQSINQLQQQIEAVNRGILDLEDLNNGLDELKDSKDKEIMAHVGKGIFIKSKIIENDLLVDVGGKNLVKKKPSEAKELIQEQIQKLKEMNISLNQSLEQVNQEVMGLIQEAEGRG